MSCYGKSMKQDLAAGTQLFFYRLFFSPNKKHNLSCSRETAKCKGKVHVARRLPSSALVVLFRAKSQSALIMLLEPQTYGSTFRRLKTEGMLYTSRCWGCGSARAKARLKDLVCATCGRAVSFPDTTPSPSHLLHNPWRTGSWKSPEHLEWSRAGEENDPGAGRQMWSFWSVLGSKRWKNGLWASQEVLFSIGGMDDSFLELNEGWFREIH